MSPGYIRSKLPGAFPCGVIARALGVALCIAGAYLMLLPDDAGRVLAAGTDPYQIEPVQTSADLAQHSPRCPTSSSGPPPGGMSR